MFFSKQYFVLKTVIITVALSIFSVEVSAQDELKINENIREIQLLKKWCSPLSAFSTEEISYDLPASSCYGKDHFYGKWFKIKLNSKFLEIKVLIGDDEGSMAFPYVYLYDKDFKEISCKQYTDEKEDLILSVKDLLQGSAYYLFVSHVNHSQYKGTFSLCLNPELSNDNMEGAYIINDVTNWCSNKNDFTTLDGTPDQHKPACMSSGPNFNRWFKFTSKTAQIEITVAPSKGSSFDFPFLTLWDEFGHEAGCIKYTSSLSNTVTLKKSGMVIGKPYYITVDHPYNIEYQGEFTICITDHSGDAVIDPNQTLITGRIRYSNGTEVPQLKIDLMDKERNFIKGSSTGAHGKFKFTDIKDGQDYVVRISGLNTDMVPEVFMIKGSGKVLKSTTREGEFFIFSGLDPKRNNLGLMNPKDYNIGVQKGQKGIVGKVVNKKDPTESVADMTVYLYDDPDTPVDSVKTDDFGKFKFKKLPKDPFMVKFEKTPKETYTEMVVVDDKGKALKSANSNDIDANGYFHFKILPAIKEEMEMMANNQKELSEADLKAGKNIILSNIYFDTGSSELLPESFSELNRLAEILKKHEGVKIEIQGHTDNQGSKDKNDQISDDRAKSVVDYLINKGINKDRLSHKGFGGSAPVAGNDTEDGRRKNRRVEFKVIN